MINNKHLIYSGYLERITKNIKGGFDGLESLFNNRIHICRIENYKLSHNNFTDFFSGVPIEVLGIEGEIFIKNTGKAEDLNFENFYESYYQFNYDPTPFYSIYNLLQEVLNKLREFSFEEAFDLEEKKLFFNEIVLYISNEIEKSSKCKEEDNPILFAKLNYLKNGYLLTYNKIWELFGAWIVGIVKTDFERSLPIELSKIDEKLTENIWFKVGLLFAKGEIQKYIKDNPDTSFPERAEKFGNKSYNKYILGTIHNYNTDKDIYANKKKMQSIKDFCIANEIEICEEFEEKLERLSQDQN